jgi:hypothetical protein
MPELDQMSPEMEPTQPEMSGQVVGLEPGQTDEEGAMAKADLYKLANYSFKLFKKLEDNAQLEGWVQAKITKAADYIASVYHYLEYEMEFSEYGHKLDNSDVLSEGQKVALKNKLMEAKAKIKELKVKQAEKSKVDETRMIGGGKEEACTECGGTGMRLTMGMPVPDHVEKKVEKYKRLTKATHAAHKRLDKNHNGIPDDQELDELTAEYPGGSTNFSTGEVKGTYTPSKAVDEELSSTGGEITRPSKGVTRHTHNPNRFTDEPHTEPKSQAKSRSAADKAGDKAADKAAAKDSKDYEKKNPGTVTRVKDGKKVDPNAPKEKEVDETYGQGVYESSKLKGNQKKLDMDKDGKLEKSDFARLRSASPKDLPAKGGKVKEAKEEKFDALKHVKNPTKGEKDAAKDVKRGSYADRAAMLKSAEADDRLKEAGDKKTMSRAAKGMMKYGKDGMKALAKAGKEGKDLDKVRDKYDKYDESYVARAVAEAKKGKKPDFLDMDKDGDKKEPMKKAVADKKETVKESSELTRMLELTGRLNINEHVIVKESNEVDQLRALTKRLLG